MADSWTRPFDASYDFVRVSRETGLEVDFVRDIENGGSIERNANTALYETASLDFADKFDVGNDFLRVYLNATFTDGSKRRECLGTFMPQVDSVDIDGAYREGQINAYGLLKRLKDDDFDGPYVIVAGSNLVDEAVKIAESVGLTVYADPSSLLLGSTLVFGVGRDNDAKNKLDAVDLLLKAAGFRSPATDRMGNVIYRRYVEPADMPISAEFTEGRDARFMSDMTESTNRAEVCNVVHVDFSTQDASVRGTAVDDSPDSDLSTVSVGRRIVKSYSYDSLPGVDTEDANLVEGAANALIGTGKKLDKSFRQSDSHGSIQTVYVSDSPQVGVLFGIEVVSSGGRVGFCQDEGPSVKKDTDYTQSVWVKGTKGATGIIQSFWDQERALGPVTKGFTMTGEWQKVSYTYHATDNHSKVSWGYCYIDGGEAIFVADKVEEGGNATPWPQDAMQSAADRKAAELLATERAVTRTDEFRSVHGGGDELQDRRGCRQAGNPEADADARRRLRHKAHGEEVRAMSDSAAEIKGAAARLAAAMPSGGKRLTMEFGTVVGVHDTALDVMLHGAVVTVPMVRSCTGCIITDRAVILSQGPLAVCVGTMTAV